MVYGLLTAGGIAVYVAVVKGAEWLLREGVGLGGSLLATAIIAVGFAPAGIACNAGSTGGCTASATTPCGPWPGLVSASGTLR